MALIMQAAARAGVAVVVLDRPNPIGGSAIEGGEVESGYESFVGLGSLPVRHGLSIGEVAGLVVFFPLALRKEFAHHVLEPLEGGAVVAPRLSIWT